jgi:peptidyl-prolyl cis-trans isomerase C
MIAQSKTVDASRTGAAGMAPYEGVASINGIPLHAPGEVVDAAALRERAWGELLRQRAVILGLLPSRPVVLAPALNASDQGAIEIMLAKEVSVPEPTDAECRRYYEAHQKDFVEGQALHVRHILFAVTPGVDVHALTRRAEQALLELSRKDVPVGRFEALAQELSNCPSSAQGGDLGWVSPHDCAPELANELFHQSDSRGGMGVHPRLIRTRHGLHVIEVLRRKKGTPQSFESVQMGIVQRLKAQCEVTALRQYMQLLVGQANVQGLVLDGSASPLVQ